MLPHPAARRVVRCVVGLVLLGVGLGLAVESRLGLSPWDVLHKGIADRVPLTIGQVSILVGIVVLLGWIPLREPPGVGTILNVFVVGLSLDATIWLVPRIDTMALRVGALAVGVWLWGPGSGLYIGSGLGAGPRDGLMTGLARKGLPVGPVRIGLEATAMLTGLALGGPVGIGTLAFVLGVGPNVAWWLPRLTMPVDVPSFDP